MKAILRKRAHRRALADRGTGLLEPLMVSVMLFLTVAAMANVFNGITRSMASMQKRQTMDVAIEKYLAEASSLAREYTCCSGQCKTSPSNVGVDKPCATNDSRDDRYFFPQLDLASTTTPFPNTSTSSEPLAVEQLCADNKNDAFMSELFGAVRGWDPPTHTIREVSVLPNKTLSIKLFNRDNNNLVRVAMITPKMADFCP